MKGSGRSRRSKKPLPGQDYKSFKHNRKRFFLSENTKGHPGAQQAANGMRREGDIPEAKRKLRSNKDAPTMKSAESVALPQGEATEAIAGTAKPPRPGTRDGAKSSQDQLEKTGDSGAITNSTTTQKSRSKNGALNESMKFGAKSPREQLEEAGESGAGTKSSTQKSRLKSEFPTDPKDGTKSPRNQFEGAGGSGATTKSTTHKSRPLSELPTDPSRMGPKDETKSPRNQFEGAGGSGATTKSTTYKSRPKNELSTDPSRKSPKDGTKSTGRSGAITKSTTHRTHPKTEHTTESKLYKAPSKLWESREKANENEVDLQANSPEQIQGSAASGGMKIDDEKGQDGSPMAITSQVGLSPLQQPHSAPRDALDKEKSAITSSNSTMKATLFKSLDDLLDSMDEPPQGDSAIKPTSDPTTSGISGLKVAEETTLIKSSENLPKSTTTTTGVHDGVWKPKIVATISSREETPARILERNTTYTSESTSITGMFKSQIGKF